MQQLIHTNYLAIIILILLLSFGCASNNTQSNINAPKSKIIYPLEPEKIFIPQLQPEIAIRSNNISINGQNINAGTIIQSQPGSQKINFQGNILRPFREAKEMTGVETAELLGCIALLPICALTKQKIFPDSARKNANVKYIEYQCEGEINFDALNNEKYSIEVIVPVDSLPIVRANNDSFRSSYIIHEAFMSCEETINEN